jgi:hypothetical protein
MAASCAGKSPNDPAGFHDLADLLRSRKVSRVGLEATGGYEREIKVRLEHTRDPKLCHVMLADIERLKSRRAQDDCQVGCCLA